MSTLKQYQQAYRIYHSIPWSNVEAKDKAFAYVQATYKAYVASVGVLNALNAVQAANA